jgi:uncharacterized protein GlcG (DUF336 family)
MRSMPKQKIFSNPWFKAALAVLSVLCAAPGDCGGGGGGGGVSSSPGGGGSTEGSGIATSTYSVPDPTTQALGVADVQNILATAAHEAQARNRPAIIAVVDRVGNVLAVAQTTGAGLGPPPATVTVSGGRGVTGGLEGAAVPSTLAAIAKAITGAFLSSGGNAFTTRTASQIIQEHFNPGVTDTPGGPLFGVQFSQLPCSDFNGNVVGGNAAGPMRSPLGLSADSGGLPLYINGVLVGGIGVVTKTVYTLDLDIFNFDVDDDEVIALSGQHDYVAPAPIQAQNISAGGITLRYVDATAANFATTPAAIGTFALVGVPGFYTGAGVLAGQTYGTTTSGVRPDNAGLYPGTDAFVFDTGTGVNRFPPINGFAPAVGFITAAEARAMVAAGLSVAEQTRAQIRIPTNSFAELNVAVVDLDGNVLAMARTRDAAIFGADVSIQKARSAVFFSRFDAKSAFNEINPSAVPASSPTKKFSWYMSAQSVADPGLFSSGIAFSDDALGNLARPFYPDGIDGNPPGPLSLPFPNWSPFSTGLQLDLVAGDIVAAATGGAPSAAGCATAVLPVNAAAGEPAHTQLANGLQIFPGAVPIYRGSVLVGAVGISGDGVQQDDLTAFLAVQDGPATLNQAPAGIRSDQQVINGARLRYVNCPFAPFLNSSVQNAC